MRISRDQSGSRSQLAAVWHHRPFSMGSFYNLVTPFIRYVKSVNLIFRNTEQNLQPHLTFGLWFVILSLCIIKPVGKENNISNSYAFNNTVYSFNLWSSSMKKKKSKSDIWGLFWSLGQKKKTCNVLCSVKIQTFYELIISGRGGAPPLMQCCVQHTSPSAQQLFNFHHRVGRVPSSSLLCCNTYNLDRWKNIKIMQR